MKRTKQIRSSALLVICMSLAAHQSAARTFRAALPQIRNASFYRIALPPQVSAIAGAELRSLRLNDAQGREQPYFTGVFAAAKAKQLAVPEDRVSVPVAGFSQTDSSDKRSYLRIRFDEAYPLDRLRLEFGGPRFYSRIVRMPDMVPDWQRRIHQRQDLLVEYGFRATELLFVVANDDNPPLRLEKVEAWQKARYLTAWLEPGRYRLEYDDTGSAAPRYDITVLADSLNTLPLPVVRPGVPEPMDTFSRLMPLQEEKPQAGTPDSPHAAAILTWCIIGGVVIALILATRSLVRRIGAGRDGEA